jgi:tRNA (guanine26-N2/guanine27-N2)-dimethyltransferase
LVLHSLATAAARYGRYIEPLVSLSIDFYVRVFVRVRTAPNEVKKLASKTAMYYVCTGCQAFHEQPLGRVIEKTNEKSGHVNVNTQFKTAGGPPVGERCVECNSTMHVAGPMWSAPIHDRHFAGKVLEHLEANKESYGTYPRMRGMLTIANEVGHRL